MDLNTKIEKNLNHLDSIRNEFTGEAGNLLDSLKEIILLQKELLQDMHESYVERNDGFSDWLTQRFDK